MITGIYSVEVETKNKILTLILLQLDLFKAAYVPRLRIKPFVVRFSRVKVAVGSAFTRSSRSDHGGASTHNKLSNFANKELSIRVEGSSVRFLSDN